MKHMTLLLLIEVLPNVREKIYKYKYLPKHHRTFPSSRLFVRDATVAWVMLPVGRAEPLLGAAESFGHLRRLLKTRWRNGFFVANLKGRGSIQAK